MRGTFVAFLTNVIDDLGEIGTVPFIFQMNVLKTSVTSRKTISCLNVCLPCCSDTLQAPKICAVAHTSLLHQMHIVSVVILHLLRLAGDGSVSYLEARQQEVRLASWHCHQRGPREALLNIVHPSCPLTLNLQLGSFGEGIGIIN